MATYSVTYRFSTEENAQTLTKCLEQLVRNLSLEPEEEA